MKKRYLLSVLLILFVGSVSAEVHEGEDTLLPINDFSWSVAVSGNGLGVHQCLSAGFRMSERTTFECGLVFQSRNLSISGISAGFRCCLMPVGRSFSGRTSIYLYCNMQRLIEQHLSTKSIEVENKCQAFLPKEAPENLTLVHFNSWEFSGGVGCTLNIISKLYVNSRIGISYYKAIQLNYQEVELKYAKEGIVTYLGGGLSWRFNEPHADSGTMRNYEAEEISDTEPAD